MWTVPYLACSVVVWPWIALLCTVALDKSVCQIKCNVKNYTSENYTITSLHHRYLHEKTQHTNTFSDFFMTWHPEGYPVPHLGSPEIMHCHWLTWDCVFPLAHLRLCVPIGSPEIGCSHWLARDWVFPMAHLRLWIPIGSPEIGRSHWLTWD